MSGAGSDALRVQYRPATFARTRKPFMPPIAEPEKAHRAPTDGFGASHERFGASKRKGLAGPSTRQVLNSARILARRAIVRRLGLLGFCGGALCRFDSGGRRRNRTTSPTAENFPCFEDEFAEQTENRHATPFSLEVRKQFLTPLEINRKFYFTLPKPTTVRADKQETKRLTPGKTGNSANVCPDQSASSFLCGTESEIAGTSNVRRSGNTRARMPGSVQCRAG